MSIWEIQDGEEEVYDPGLVRCLDCWCIFSSEFDDGAYPACGSDDLEYLDDNN